MPSQCAMTALGLPGDALWMVELKDWKDCNFHGPFVNFCGQNAQMQEGRAHIENLKTGRLLGLGCFS